VEKVSLTKCGGDSVISMEPSCKAGWLAESTSKARSLTKQLSHRGCYAASICAKIKILKSRIALAGEIRLDDSFNHCELEVTENVE
jgi:hypothetical protein